MRYNTNRFKVEFIEGAYDLYFNTLQGMQYIDTFDTIEEVEEEIFNIEHEEE